MPSTGKSEITASIFVIASNAFTCENVTREEDNKLTKNQTKHQQKRKTVDQSGATVETKAEHGLFDLEQVVKEKESQLAEVAR
jgi:hypothetical protein